MVDISDDFDNAFHNNEVYIDKDFTEVEHLIDKYNQDEFTNELKCVLKKTKKNKRKKKALNFY